MPAAGALLPGSPHGGGRDPQAWLHKARAVGTQTKGTGVSGQVTNPRQDPDSSHDMLTRHQDTAQTAKPRATKVHVAASEADRAGSASTARDVARAWAEPMGQSQSRVPRGRTRKTAGREARPAPAERACGDRRPWGDQAPVPPRPGRARPGWGSSRCAGPRAPRPQRQGQRPNRRHPAVPDWAHRPSAGQGRNGRGNRSPAGGQQRGGLEPSAVRAQTQSGGLGAGKAGSPAGRGHCGRA